MPKGLSLHIGVNFLKVGLYCSSAGLKSPQNNARAMAAIAVMEGFAPPVMLLNEEATKTNFLHRLDAMIPQLESGDSFLLTFSGHGGQISDDSGDEADGLDEIWCFHDEYLLDDEIAERWKLFKRGVQVIVVSDSCHSRTALKAWDKSCFSGGPFKPADGCEKEININDQTVLSSHIHDPEILADIIHLSACDDKRETSDGAHFSAFTGLLLNHYDYGRYTGTYQQLVTDMQARSMYLQKPGFQTLGANRPYLQNKIPFKLY